MDSYSLRFGGFPASHAHDFAPPEDVVYHDPTVISNVLNGPSHVGFLMLFVGIDKHDIEGTLVRRKQLA